MKRYLLHIVFFLSLMINFSGLEAQRFPKPEFESGHSQPLVQKPEPRSNTWEYVDIFVLFASLSVVSWLVLKRRSRKGVLLMAMFSILYFGFFREGCICSVGSLQNVTLAIFQPGYVIPLSAVIFFMLPLIFTLAFGRTFCAGVCPLGAIQDLVVLKPIEIKPWLQKTLGILPIIYLGLAILYSATASDFIICRYDPFIGIYRLDGTFLIFLLGALLLGIGVFIARPYCRFLCPYGVLLNWVSRFSKYHMSITPSKCIDCTLCERSCPFGAIEKPVRQNVKIEKSVITKRFLFLAFIIPILTFLGGWSGRQISEKLAMVNPKVKMSSELIKADANPDLPLTLNVESFRSSGKANAELYQESLDILDDFKMGSSLLGAFIGLAIALSLASLAKFKYRSDYEPNRATCLSCARCMDFCPVDKENEYIVKKLLT